MASTKRKRKRDEEKVDEGMNKEIIMNEVEEKKIIKEEEEEKMKEIKEEAEVLVGEEKLTKKRREQ